jgi:3-methyladenine DNA glycosylase Tag
MATRQEQAPREEGPGAPPQIRPKRLGDYLDVMSKAVFQSGISWRVVEKKWPTTREAFHGFDCERVALMSDREIDALTKDERVIRNRRKLVAVVENANRILELDKEHGAFRKYLRSFPDYESLVKDLRKRFKFLGDMGCYYFLYVVKEQVPEYHEWREAHPSPRHR